MFERRVSTLLVFIVRASNELTLREKHTAVELGLRLFNENDILLLKFLLI